MLNGKCCSIWDYLVQLTADKQVTVVITTHYIEEAKQADVVSVTSALNSCL
jgi:ABC-type multidrug transport system ATPase subunit